MIVMKEIMTHQMFSLFVSAAVRKTSDNSSSARQQNEADPNKKKNIRKTKGGIKVH